ncbi:MAG: acyltransferase family protein [Streptosporangiaceae bacterium]
MDGAAPDRNRYADLLRVAAMAGVVYGHWLLINVTDTGGQLGGMDALGYVSWGRWGTLLFQVMPVFFLVGGYVNARSWTAHAQYARDPAPPQPPTATPQPPTATPQPPTATPRSPVAPRIPWAAWTQWVRHRAIRLLRPATVYVAVAVLAVAAARLASATPGEVAEAGWLVALQLWFLPVYLLVIALTPALLAAHRRWGLAVPAAMALGAAAIDAAVLGLHLPVVGYANYLLVWGAMHQLGFGWHDGTLTRPRWRPYALAATGILLLTGLLLWGPFPVDMIGDGEPVTNTTPPSIALLAFAAAQLGILLAAEPAASRLLFRPRLWRLVSRLNTRAITVYLWHMVPVIVIAVTFYPAGILPQPAIATAEWWPLRVAWFALLTLVLIPIVLILTPADRPLPALRLARSDRPQALVATNPTPTDDPTATDDPSSTVRPARIDHSPAARAASRIIVLAGCIAAAVGLARLAIAGFAPDGRLPLLVLAAYAAGLVVVAAAPRLPGMD